MIGGVFPINRSFRHQIRLQQKIFYKEQTIPALIDWLTCSTSLFSSTTLSSSDRLKLLDRKLTAFLAGMWKRLNKLWKGISTRLTWEVTKSNKAHGMTLKAKIQLTISFSC